MGTTCCLGLPVVTGSVIAAVADPVPPSAVSFGCQQGVEQTFTVPTGVDRLAVGAGGGSGAASEHGSASAGRGAMASAVLPVTAGQVLAVQVGCAGKVRTGGQGWAHGGSGGDSGVGEDGGAGGGATGVSLVSGTRARTPELIVGGGGGAGGGSGLGTGQSGAGGVHNPSLGSGGQTTTYGPDGWGSKGGGGGGGGAGGWRGGNNGRGGSYWGDYGGRGWGGSSYSSSIVQSAQWTDGGAPLGDGYVILVPVLSGQPSPALAAFGCNKGTPATWTVPTGTFRISVTALGAAGSAAQNGAAGFGGQTQATINTTPGQSLSVIAGCQGGLNGTMSTTGGAGYGNAGLGGHNSGYGGNDGGGGGGGSALLSATSAALVVAGGGGGGGGDGTFGHGGSGGNGSQAGEPGGSGTHSGSGGGGRGGQQFNGGRNGTNGSNSDTAGNGGGGGGGYHGGQGGNAGSVSIAGGGGGGGSSFVEPSVLTQPAVFRNGVQSGNGFVVIVAARAVAPSAPTGVTAVAGNRQATVSYTAGSDGGSQPVSFTVTASPGGRTAQGTGNQLIVSGLTNGVAYTFTVTATNRVGTSAASAPSNRVTPVGPPGAPTNVTATPGNHTGTVLFTPPTDTGGLPITGYTVTIYPGGFSTTVFSSPALLPALNNGTTYTVTVTATNSQFTGLPSTLSNPFIPSTVPAPPSGVSAIPGNQQATVSFTPPTDSGGLPVTGYRVTASPGGASATGTTSPVVVTGLTNGTSYTFTVTALNATGTSAASAPSAAVIPGTIPSPPLLVTAAPRDGKALVDFHIPLDDGGSPITSYTVTASPGGATGTGPAGPITVDGLTNGMAYTFTVVATNGLGNSQPSPASSPVTPTSGPNSGPPNDDFVNAQPITGTSGSVAGSNVGATLESGEPPSDLNQTSGATIWYRFDLPVGGGAVQFDLCGSTFAGTIGVFQGDSLDQLDFRFPGRPTARCSDGSTAPAAFFDLNISGGTYYIAVAGVDNGAGPAEGSVQLNWAPANGG